MAKIIYFSIETQVSLNNILSEIFEILAVDNQMVTSCGQDEPHRSPKKEYFSCVIGTYLMSFIYEHPVFGDLTEGLEPMRHPQPPKNTYFLKIQKILLKIVIFQKSRFFLG